MFSHRFRPIDSSSRASTTWRRPSGRTLIACCVGLLAVGVLPAISRAGGVDAPSAAPPAPAQATEWGQVLDGYVARALATHPTSAHARAEVGAARAALSTARWQLAPTPSFSRDYDASTSAYTNVARLEQPLWTGGRITSGINAARAGVASSESALLDGQRTLALKVVQIWSDWAKALRLRDALNDLENEHRELLGLIQRRYGQGVATVAEVGLAKVRLSSVLSEQGQARVNGEYQRGLLASATGGSVDAASSHDLDIGVPQAPTASELMASVDSAPAVHKAQADVQAAEAELEAHKAALQPQLFLRYERQWGAVHDDKVYVAVQASLGAGLSTMSDLSAQRAKIEAAQQAVSAVRQDLREQYMLEFTRMDAARQRQTDAQMAVESGRAVVESYRRQFDAGRRSWVELLDMVRELHQLRIEATNAQLDYRAALYRILLLLRPLASDSSDDGVLPPALSKFLPDLRPVDPTTTQPALP